MKDWQIDLSSNITKLEDLKNYLDISSKREPELKKVINRHPMRIPQYYLNLINKDDPDDPIRKMSIPTYMELDENGEYDTSGESLNTKMPGLQHKYSKTALVLSTNVCFMYCRHCFRKRLVGYSKEEIMGRMNDSIEYIAQHKEINNVLISGGDSFALSNEMIEEYLKNLCQIDHLDFIRFGTRIPVVFPQRIYKDPELIKILDKYNKTKKIFLVTQFNHPRELTKEAKKAIDSITNIGISVQNQTVLLKSINDNPQILAKLLNGLTRFGINPYYVFQCRPVKYIKSNFQVSLIEGYKAVEEAKKHLNGISKRFRYAMSHPRGKIEIIGLFENQMIFKFHQAKDSKDMGKIFMKKIDQNAKWLNPDLNPIE